MTNPNRVWDRSTGAFFNSRDILFDENGLDHVLDDNVPPPFDLGLCPNYDATTDALASDPSPLPVVDAESPIVRVPLGDSALLPPAPPASPLPSLCEPSSRPKQLSHLGAQYEASRVVEKAKSAKLSAAWHAHHDAINTRGDPAFPLVSTDGASDSSSHVFDNDFANLICKESACLLIRSDRPRNPASPSYDMSLLPATFAEAHRRPDFAIWNAVAQRVQQPQLDGSVSSVRPAAGSQSRKKSLGV